MLKFYDFARYVVIRIAQWFSYKNNVKHKTLKNEILFSKNTFQCGLR